MRQLFYGRYSLLRIYLSKWTALGYSQRYFDKLEVLDAYNMRKKNAKLSMNPSKLENPFRIPVEIYEDNNLYNS